MDVTAAWLAVAGRDVFGLCNEGALRECLLGDSGYIGFSIQLINMGLILWILSIEGRRFAHERAETSYGDLDELYHSLLQQRLTHPWLVDLRLFVPSGGMTLDQAEAARRTHAYMVWTMIETIHDRLDRRGAQCVWQPIVRREGALFLPELERFWREERAFQDRFIAFMRKGGFANIYPSKSADEAATRRFAEQVRAVLGPV